MERKHVINIVVNNHPGVMSHVSGLFTRRSYNIDSIAVGATDNPAISTMTIVIRGDEVILGQVKKQLLKLPDVIVVEEMEYANCVQRELVLISIEISDKNRAEALALCNGFGAKVLEITPDSLLLEFSGNSRQVENMIQVCKGFGIRQIRKTGQIAIHYRNPQS